MNNFLTKIFKRKNTVNKSASWYDQSTYSGCGSIYGFGNATYAASYYATVSALFTGISTIADAASDYEYTLIDESTLEVIDSPETERFLSIINNPNPYESKEKFVKKAMSNFMLEAECFIYVEKGAVSGNIIKMVNITNSYVTRSGNLTRDGFPDSFRVSQYQEGEYRFNYDADREIITYADPNDENRILIPIGGYAPGGEEYCPVSAIRAATSELMQFVQGNTHNNSLLRNGSAMGSVLNYEGELTEEQFNRVNKQLRDGFQGAMNAGKPIITEGKLKSIQNLTMSNRDMEYKELKEQNEKAVYKVLKLPLPLFMDRSMTFDNVRQGRELLHEQSTIPPMNYILGEISRVLLPKGQRLIVNELEVPALRSKRLTQATATSKGGYLTINEIRASVGYAPIAGGDVLLNGPTATNSSLATDAPSAEDAEKARVNIMVKNGVPHDKAEQIVGKTRTNCDCC